MGLLDALVRTSATVKPTEERWGWADWFNYQSNQYLVQNAMTGSRPDQPDATYLSYIDTIHRRNGVVSAAVVARALLVSQLRFRWRNDYTSNTPGRTFGNADLAVLERPGQVTRPELLFLLEHDVSYSGSAYVVRRSASTIQRLRPDYVTVAMGSDSEPTWDGDMVRPPYDAQVVGIIYEPPGARPEMFRVGEFARWMPEPDPIHWWRGSSWVSSLLREVSIDGQVFDHQSKFFEHAATPNMVFMMDPAVAPEKVKAYAEIVNENHAGAMNSYKNMFLGGGTDVKVVGSSLESLSLKDVSGGFEARVAARSRVPAVVLGTREGLGGSALNSGNYAQTRRLLADGWFFPTAENLCAALEPIMRRPSDSELWFDADRVMFLQEDQQDAADIASTNASTITMYVREGFTAESAKDAVIHGDLSKLVHTNLVSVQLQEPGANDNATDAPSGATPAIGSN